MFSHIISAALCSPSVPNALPFAISPFSPSYSLNIMLLSAFVIFYIY